MGKLQDITLLYDPELDMAAKAYRNSAAEDQVPTKAGSQRRREKGTILISKERKRTAALLYNSFFYK